MGVVIISTSVFPDVLHTFCGQVFQTNEGHEPDPLPHHVHGIVTVAHMCQSLSHSVKGGSGLNSD